MIRVILESPLKSDTLEGMEANKVYARQCMMDCIMNYGEAPFASHLLYEGTGLLDDTNQRQRTLGIKMGYVWGKMAHKVVVYTDHGITVGMKINIDYYTHEGIPLEYRRLHNA